jgi:hypothetical protein
VVGRSGQVGVTSGQSQGGQPASDSHAAQAHPADTQPPPVQTCVAWHPKPSAQSESTVHAAGLYTHLETVTVGQVSWTTSHGGQSHASHGWSGRQAGQLQTQEEGAHVEAVSDAHANPIGQSASVAQSDVGPVVGWVHMPPQEVHSVSGGQAGHGTGRQTWPVAQSASVVQSSVSARADEGTVARARITRMARISNLLHNPSPTPSDPRTPVPVRAAVAGRTRFQKQE